MAHPLIPTALGVNNQVLQAAPAPNANHFGSGKSNVSSFTVTDAEAYVFEPQPTSTLVRVSLSGPCRILVNGGADISATGFLTDAATEIWSIPTGAPVAFQAVDGEVEVQVLEA